MKAIHYVNRFLVSFVLLSVSALHALDSQGNVTVAGFVNTDLNDLRDTLFSVVQYNPSGQIDTTFGQGGVATLGFRHGVAMDVIIDPTDDSIVVVGTAIDPSVGLPRAIIAKFLPDGTPDPSFNMGGALDGGLGFGWLVDGPSIANGLCLDTNSMGYRICGSFISNGRYSGFSYFILYDGTSPSLRSYLDTKLNATVLLKTTDGLPCVGKIISEGTPRPVIVDGQINDAIVFIASISGEFLDVALGQLATVDQQASYAVGSHGNKGLLARFTSINSSPFSPVLDTNFGSNGYVIAEFGNKQTVFNTVQVAAINGPDPDRIFVCGTARSLQSRMFVAEYDTSGNLVPSFGDNGIMTLFEGPNIQTIARSLILPNFTSFDQFSNCPTGSSTGMFAVGSANGRTPLIANLNCSNGFLKTAYGDKAIASLETEALTSMTVLKETEPMGTPLPTPASSPFARRLNALVGNPFAVSLTGSGDSSGFVLQPGRYYLDAQAPLADVNAHQLALYNDQESINELLGDAIWNSSGILTKALLKGQLFVSSGPTKYILRHYFNNPGIGFSPGQPANLSGLEEVYAQMNILQL